MLFSTVHNFGPSQAERSKPNPETSILLYSYRPNRNPPPLRSTQNEPFTVKKVLFAAYWALKVRVFVYIMAYLRTPNVISL